MRVVAISSCSKSTVGPVNKVLTFVGFQGAAMASLLTPVAEA
jgi:hypothetical protein